jgi:hypothetical protein
MRRVFFHVHIWKTGGTSFLNICSENFGKGFHRDFMLIQNWFLSIQQLQWLLEYHDWIRCYSCHMLSGQLPYDSEGKEVLAIAFVRDPVNRFISSYSYQRGDNYRGGVAKDFDFDGFIRQALVDTDNPMWRNGQVFVLGGSRTENGIDIIMENVRKGHLILLPTERFDESCILLEKMFPEDFKDCSYIRYNVSKRTKPATDDQRAAISRYMDLDFKLLAHANSYLDSNLDRLFASIGERQFYLDDFKHRCEMKKRRNRVVMLGKKVKRAIRSVLK